MEKLRRINYEHLSAVSIMVQKVFPLSLRLIYKNMADENNKGYVLGDGEQKVFSAIIHRYTIILIFNKSSSRTPQLRSIDKHRPFRLVSALLPSFRFLTCPEGRLQTASQSVYLSDHTKEILLKFLETW